MGQGICRSLAGNERGIGHEAGRNRRERLLLLLQPPEKAKAHLFARLVKRGSSRAELTVCIHEQRVRPLNPSAGGGLCLFGVAAQALQPRLRVGSALEGKAGLSAGSLGLCAGLFCALPFLRKLTAEVLFLRLRRRQLLK
jgi:hypothetical protein